MDWNEAIRISESGESSVEALRILGAATQWMQEILLDYGRALVAIRDHQATSELSILPLAERMADTKRLVDAGAKLLADKRDGRA
jgi:hypothetical protein